MVDSFHLIQSAEEPTLQCSHDYTWSRKRSKRQADTTNQRNGGGAHAHPTLVETKFLSKFYDETHKRGAKTGELVDVAWDNYILSCYRSFTPAGRLLPMFKFWSKIYLSKLGRLIIHEARGVAGAAISRSSLRGLSPIHTEGEKGEEGEGKGIGNS